MSLVISYSMSTPDLSLLNGTPRQYNSVDDREWLKTPASAVSILPHLFINTLDITSHTCRKRKETPSPANAIWEGECWKFHHPSMSLVISYSTYMPELSLLNDNPSKYDSFDYREWPKTLALDVSAMPDLFDKTSDITSHTCSPEDSQPRKNQSKEWVLRKKKSSLLLKLRIQIQEG